MGIDVNLYAVGQVSDEQIAAAEVYLRARIGNRSPNDDDPLLEREYWEWAKDPNRIEFNSWHRHFPTYRTPGLWPAIFHEIMLLGAVFPTLTIHYGSDQEDDCRQVDNEYIAELWRNYLDIPLE